MYRGPGVPRRFWLIRETGTGAAEIVAEGTQSSTGQVVVFPPNSSIPAIWPDFEALLSSRPGTLVHWLDQDRIALHCIP